MAGEVNKNRKYTTQEVVTYVKKTNESDKTSLRSMVQSIANAIKVKHL